MLTAPKITPMAELVCPYYLRTTVIDQPGVLAQLTGIFGKHQVSIRSMVQQQRGEKEAVYVVFRVIRLMIEG